MKKLIILLLIIIGFNCKSQELVLDSAFFNMIADTSYWTYQNNYDTIHVILLVSDTSTREVGCTYISDTLSPIMGYNNSCYYMYGYLLWSDYFGNDGYLDIDKKRITNLVIWNYTIINK